MSAIPPNMEKGIQAEIRFFEVVRKCFGEPWLCGIEPGNVQADIGGVDAIARVKRRMTGEIVPVPVQIKSSGLHVMNHINKHPHHWFMRMVFVIVNDEVPDRSICAQLWYGLNHVRTHSYDYAEIFGAIERRVSYPSMLASFLHARQEYAKEWMRRGDS